jgi:hypothetical protein
VTKHSPYDETRVSVSQTHEDIRRLLDKNGGTSVTFVSATLPERIEGFGCAVVVIRIVAKPKQMKNPESQAQELRRIWRVLFFHMKAVFEAANSGVLEFRELIMPYIVTKDGRTVGEHILPALDEAITGNPERLLPGPHK